MDKTRLLGWVLITAIFLIWLNFNAKQQSQKQKAAALKKQDSLSQVEKPVDKAPARKTVSLEAAGESNPLQDISEQPTNLPDTVRVSEKDLTVETNDFIVTFSNQGAKIASLKVKALKGKKDSTIPEIIPQDQGGALSLSLDGMDLSEKLWEIDSLPDTLQLFRGKLAITFSYRLPSGKKLVRIYTVYADSQFISHLFHTETGHNEWALNWQSGLRETEKISAGKGFGQNYGFFSEVIFNSGVSVVREVVKGKKRFNEKSGVLRWAGLRRKYIAALLNFHRNTDNIISAEEIKQSDSKTNSTYRFSISNDTWTREALNFDFYILPLKYQDVLAYGQSYEKIIFSGWEKFMRADIWYVKLCGFVLNLLNIFYNLIPNYGIAIIILTLLVRLVLLPLTVAQTKSMSGMQEHQPAIKEIKAKYRGNTQKANQEVMAYYREKGINPMGGMMGCVPMILQFPVFIALFNVLGRALELKEAPFFLWISDLSRPDVLISAVQIPWLFPAGITVLPALMAITMYFQTKMTITDPNQKAMVYMMPVMMFFLSASFPSGLVLYWTVSNVFTIGQTVILKKHKTPTAGKMKTAGPVPHPPSKKRKAKSGR